MNACDKAREFGKFQSGRVDRAVTPGEEVSVKVNSDKQMAYDLNNSAYGDNQSDYVVVVGCLSYALGSSELRGNSTFAYVIGKRVGNKFLRIGRGDGVMFGKGLKWLSLHEAYQQ
jgi:hypothetical protein